MANIVLKDKNGANIVYKNVDYVSFQTPEGRTVRFNERAAAIISVTELPTEDINDNAIYRLTTKDEDGKTTVEFYAHENSGEWIEVAEGAKMSDLEITKNGEYTPVEAEDGFAKVKVNIDTFTDVAELPIENIDGDAIYRVITKDADTGSVVIVNAELVTAEAGEVLGKVFNYIVVDELPALDALEAPTTDDAGIVTANAYILKNTGVPYYTAIDDAGILFLAEMGLLSEYEFKGMLPAEVTESGMYSTITVGTTYTTYGLLDANNTKTVLEFTADEGWIECGNGGNVTPLEITKNGVTYDENTVMDYVGKLEPGSRYVYKQKIDRAIIEELYNNYAEDDGFLFVTETPDGVMLENFVDSYDNEYILVTNSINGACQAYCTGTAAIGPAGHRMFLYEGWNVIGAVGDSTPPTTVGDDMRVVLYTPPKAGEGSEDIDGAFEYFEEKGLWKIFEEHLLAKKVDTDNLYTVTPVGEAPVGTFKGVEVGAVDFGLTVDQMKEIPLLEMDNYAMSAVYQFIMMTEFGAKFMLKFAGASNPETTITPEMIESYKNMYETDAYFCIDMLEMVMVYVKDITAAGHEDLVGDFENGHWYMPDIPIELAFLTYQKSTYDAFNPVTVNIPNADTIVEVEELPTEEINNSKIYKVTEAMEPKYEIMVNLSGDACLPLTTLLSAAKGTKFELFGVETLPETFIPSTETEVYYYLVLPTGELYKSTDGVTPISDLSIISSSCTTDDFGGTVCDPKYTPTDSNVRYFFLKTVDNLTTYGLPANGSDKQYVRFNDNTSTWEELGSGALLMTKVDELPTENISTDKVYCIDNSIPALLDIYVKMSGSYILLSEYLNLMGSVLGMTVNYAIYAVDELPENPKVSSSNEEQGSANFYFYVLNSTGEAYASTDGTTYVSPSEEGFMNLGPYLGKISDTSEADPTADGYYTIMREASTSYIYGIPNDSNNKTIMVYRNGAWVRFVEETPAVDPDNGEGTDPTDPENSGTEEPVEPETPVETE